MESLSTRIDTIAINRLAINHSPGILRAIILYAEISPGDVSIGLDSVYTVLRSFLKQLYAQVRKKEENLRESREIVIKIKYRQ